MTFAITGVAIALPMHSAMNRFFPSGSTNHFHDIDLPAGRPPDSRKVFAQHPECWPDTLPLGQCRANVNATVLKIELVFRNNSGGGIVKSLMRFLPRRDHQVAIEKGCIVVAIILKLVISPPVLACSYLMCPIRLIEDVAVELIMPQQSHAGVCRGS